jgi:RNA polymerase sigma-70 factor (sigma-E family)
MSPQRPEPVRAAEKQLHRGHNTRRLQQDRSLACPNGVPAQRDAIVTPMGDAEGEDRLAELYTRFAPNAIRVAYLMTGDRPLAEDIVQDAFIRFAGRLHSLRDPGAFEAYLRRTIVNLTKNHFRRRALERSDLERRASERRLEHADRDVADYEAMRVALLQLPVRQRTAIVLRYYEDLPESQIAELLRCRPATVRSLVARGLEALRHNPEVIR